MSLQRVLWLVLLLGVCPAPGAAAQEQAPPEEERADDGPRDRPFEGLFGWDPRRDPDRRVDLSASLFGGFDENVLARQRVGIPGTPQADAESIVYGANATLSYLRRWEHASMNAFASTAASGFPDVDSDVRAAYNGGLGFTAPLSRRATFSASGTVALVPFYQLGALFPTLPPVVSVDVPVTTPGFEYSLVPAEALRVSGQVNFSRELSRYGSLAVSYRRSSATYRDSANDGFDTVEQRGGATYSHQVGRYVGVRAGYYYRTGRYGLLQGGRPYRSHDIDVGADYSRNFSFWERTRFSFSTGSSVIVSDRLAGVPRDRTHFFVTGNASLVREFLRSWSARLNYQRGVNYMDGFTAPLLSDSVSAGLGGQLARRVRTDLRVAMSRGTVGLDADRSGYETWTAQATMHVAASRNASAYLQYVFYQYDFGQGVALPPGLARDLNRNSVRAGVSIWLPVL